MHESRFCRCLDVADVVVGRLLRGDLRSVVVPNEQARDHVLFLVHLALAATAETVAGWAQGTLGPEVRAHADRLEARAADVVQATW